MFPIKPIPCPLLRYVFYFNIKFCDSKTTHCVVCKYFHMRIKYHKLLGALVPPILFLAYEPSPFFYWIKFSVLSFFLMFQQTVSLFQGFKFPALSLLKIWLP